MKKVVGIFAILITCILVIKGSVFANVIFTDIQNTKYEEAVINLVRLGIFQKNSNNILGVDKEVTKLEMTKLLVKSLALEKKASISSGETKYKDVPGDHEASGYINVLSEYGCIDIDTEGYFYPNKNITYAEAVTYCIRILGYGNIVDSSGTWPTNYMEQAIDLEISQGIDLEANDKITRGDLSLLLWNTFNTEMYTNNLAGTTITRKTLLEIKFPEVEIYKKKYKVEIIPNENGIIQVDKNEVASEEELLITIIPNEGYNLDALNIDYRGNGNSRNFFSKVKDNKLAITCKENNIKIEAIFRLIELPSVVDEETDNAENESETSIQGSETKKIINVCPNPILGRNRNYTGKEVELVLEGFDSEIMTVSGNRATETGGYEAIISVKDPEKYAVSYNGTTSNFVKIKWSIVEVWILLPIIPQKNMEYTGKEIELKINDVNENNVNIVGNKATEVGDYEVVISLKDSQNYRWADGSTDDIRIKWKIINSNLEDENKINEDEINEDEINEDEINENEINENEINENEINEDEINENEINEDEINEDERTEVVDNSHEEEQDSKNRYVDVRTGEWYYESVQYAITNGLFKGVSNDEFAPNVEMDRAMVVTVLHRLAGENQVESEQKFNDLDKDSYYEKAVNWASQNKIVSGINEKEFAPHNKITREQLVVMLYRFAKLNEIDIYEKVDLSYYEDESEISDYAKEAMAWAVKAGYINGRSEKALEPHGTATRAEVATILMRFNKAY